MPLRKSYRKRRPKVRRRKRTSLRKQIESSLARIADRKFKVVRQPVATLPTYNPLTNPFSSFDLCKVSEGIGNEFRIGQRITPVSMSIRMTFELPSTSAQPVAYLRYFIVRWPNKNSLTIPNDMHNVLDGLSSGGASTSFPVLFNSAYNPEAALKYKVLRTGAIAMVQRTSTQLKTINLAIPVKNTTMDFGPFSGNPVATAPIFNNVSLYLMCNNNTVQYSFYTKLTYIDV
ncbi:MAG: coat protein [Cressdnaviricota sp.]|nr:MAG: coat protein [Cressdnaviricota sp.]